MDKAFSLDTVVAQAEGLVAVDMDDEKVMLHVKTGKYFGLDRVGGAIWELIAAPCSIGGVVAALLKEYNVPEEVCQRETLAFFEMLYGKELIDVVV